MNRYFAQVAHEDHLIEIDAEAVESVGIESLIRVGCSVSGCSYSLDDVKFIVHFPSVAIFMSFVIGSLDDHLVCCICERLITRREANNAAPFHGICCDECNVRYVIPRRLGWL